jgi:Family of unknown function (DUF6527)
MADPRVRLIDRVIERVRSRLPLWLRKRLGRRRYRPVVPRESADSDEIARIVRRGHPVAEMKGTRPTWLRLLCPCRCGEILRVNLMQSEYPVWSMTIDASGHLTLVPSLDVLGCRSHFWVTRGRVRWVG